MRRETQKGAKNRWFQQKAAEAQEGRNGGKVVWKCIRDIQHGRRGLVPLKATQVSDDDAVLHNCNIEMEEALF